MTLAQLEAFYWIASLGSFHAAAARLRIAQPTISVRIRALEQSLKMPLFERRGRRVLLTPAGSELVEQVGRILTLTGDIAGKPPVDDPLRARLRLGAPDSFAMVCLPTMLRLLGREFPDLKVALTVENSAVLNQQVDAGELDVAFVSNPRVGNHARAEYLGLQDIGWVASPRLDLPKRALRPADLTRFPVFTNPEPSRLIEIVRDWFAGAGRDTVRISTCNSLAVIVRLTAAGAGISLLPIAIAQTELRSGTLRRLKVHPPIPPQHLAAVYRVGVEPTGIARVLSTARRVLAQKKFLLHLGPDGDRRSIRASALG